jgi:hypothetical protein
MESPGARVPAHERLVADLRTLRRHGPIRIREISLPALEEAAERCGLLDRVSRNAEGEYEPAAIEELIRDAIALLDEGDLSAAAGYTFGLAAGTRSWNIGERRRRAAEKYGVSVDRFRKHQEKIVIDQVAEAIIKLCVARAQPAAVPTSSPRTLRGHSTVPLTLLTAGVPRTLTLHVMPIELIRGIDVVVSSENVGLEMSKLFRPTVSAALRRAGARRNPAGEIVDDTIQRELIEWVRRHGHIGMPVAAGTVVVTGAGALINEGVRRIYHAAVAVPHPDANDYSVAPDAVAIAIRNVFRLAAKENEEHDPPLVSVCFPLFGAGRGGVDAATSFSWIWAALDQELRPDDPWRLHLVTHSSQQAEEVIRAVTIGQNDSVEAGSSIRPGPEPTQ